MKITKKSFIQAMTENQTTFVGVAKKLFEKDELYCRIHGFFEPGIILEKRTCKARSKDLEFSGGSYLSFNQNGKYEFHKYDYAGGTIYICCHIYYDDFDDIERVNAMYYLVENH